MLTKYRILGQFMPGQRLRYGAAIVAMGLATLLTFTGPLILKWAIDAIIAGKAMDGPTVLTRLADWLGGRSVLLHNLWLPGLMIALLTGLAGVFNFLKGYWSATASETVARRVRQRVYDHLNHLPCAYHDKAETGDLVQRCTSDVDTVRNFLGVQVVEIARAVIMVLAVLPFMLSLSPRLTAVAMAFVPLVFLFSFIFFSKIKSAFKLADEAEGRMTTVLQENLTGIRVVRAFARGEFECQKFAVRNAEHRDRNFKMVKLMSVYWSSSDLFCHLQNILVLVVGAYWTIGGRITPGELWAFFAWENMFIWPIRQMGRLLTELGKAQVSLGRLAEILQTPREDEEEIRNAEFGMRNGDGDLARETLQSEIRNPQSEIGDDQPAGLPVSRPPANAPAFLGRISIRDLRFGYSRAKDLPKGEKPPAAPPPAVLDGVSFEVEPGQTVALLGHSGAGKSTLVHLLLRLYDYQSGSITIDGRELRDLDRKFARSQIGSVMQEPFLYSKTLADNIRLGQAAADDQQIVHAAKVACMHDSIERFEHGYATLVGERGVTLSGGQRQRVALARAVLRNPPILLLDDALSAVDTQTESMILDALRNRRGRATTLVIAHRLTTLMAADRIIVLDHGRVVQSGSHQSLAAEPGLYRRLWQIQSDLAEDLDQELAGSTAER